MIEALYMAMDTPPAPSDGHHLTTMVSRRRSPRDRRVDETLARLSPLHPTDRTAQKAQRRRTTWAQITNAPYKHRRHRMALVEGAGRPRETTDEPPSLRRFARAATSPRSRRSGSDRDRRAVPLRSKNASISASSPAGHASPLTTTTRTTSPADLQFSTRWPPRLYQRRRRPSHRTHARPTGIPNP